MIDDDCRPVVKNSTLQKADLRGPFFSACAVVDWSASSGVGPLAPRRDALWMAVGVDGEKRPSPTYHRSRSELMGCLADWLAALRGRAVFVGFDFPFGYPVAENGECVMPTGRGLCSFLGGRVRDSAENVSNRFEVAGEFNGEIAQRFGGEAPFWGRPSSVDVAGLPVRRPVSTLIPAFRVCERWLHVRGGARPQSAWKLAYAGSVGSQALTGLMWVDRLLRDPRIADRCVLWPFETGWDGFMDGARDPIVIGEVYPSMAEHDSPGYMELSSIKDARQVAAVRDLVLDADSGSQRRMFAAPVGLSAEEVRVAGECEGWIAGA